MTAGMSTRGTIVFSHANGFPAGTYRVLFKQWQAAGYRVRAIEKFGHDPRYPVTSNWPHLRDQLIHFIEAEAEGPAWLVGHSLGGFLSVLAAARRPDLAAGVVLLDSPIPSTLRGGLIGLFKLTGAVRRFSPSHVSRKRREHWPTPSAAFDHFAMKPVFARWDQEVLRDYIRSGLEAGDEQHRLAFRREVESRIYETLPHHMTRVLTKHRLACPAAFVGGRRSAEVRLLGLDATRRVTRGRMSWIDGSHLFPFEHPGETAAEVIRWLERFAHDRPDPAPARVEPEVACL